MIKLNMFFPHKTSMVALVGTGIQGDMRTQYVVMCGSC